MRLSLVPQERRFYALFKKQGELVNESLEQLRNGLLEGQTRHPRLRDLEHECDDVTHEIYNLINQTFVTPFEREDIYSLASSLDEVVDLAEEVSDKIDLYRVKEITQSARRMGELLAKAGRELQDAVANLEGFKNLGPHRLAIHSLENQRDRVTREALAELFTDGLVVIIAALIGAIAWNLITWYLGLPSSSTHALVGALSGAAIAAAHGLSGVRSSEFWKTVLSLVISPPAGFILAAIVMTVLLVLVHRARPVPLNRTFRNLQILTAALVSYSHGANDAQKTMAVITLALVASGHLQRFQVPVWVVLLSASAIAFGTYAGGWRIIKTLGWRIYKLDPATGFAAQLTGAAVIQFATQFGLPVSTTHVVTGSVMGAGASQRLSALRWGVGANIVLAWVLTIPAAGLIAWVTYAMLNTAGLRG